MTRTEDLEVALDEAISLAQEGWDYVDKYYWIKWGAQERLDALLSVHQGGTIPRLKDGTVPLSWPRPAYKEELAKDANDSPLSRLEAILKETRRELPALRKQVEEGIAILRRMADKASSYGR